MKIILFTALIVFLAGCGEKTITNTIITEGKPGDIVGRAALYDNDYQKPEPYAYGITVTVSNSSFSVSTETDSSGSWALKEVPPGTYAISFEKEGYAAVRDFALSYSGNGTLSYRSRFYLNVAASIDGAMLFKIYDETPLLIVKPFIDRYTIRKTTEIDTTRKDSVVFKTVIDTIPGYYTAFEIQTTDASGIILYFGKTNEVSAANPNQYLFAAPPVNSGGIPITMDQLHAAGFSKGEMVYCAAYNSNYYSKYYQPAYDPYLKRNVFGVGKAHSEVKSFICP